MEREESDLYGLPLDEFVPKRTQLEKRLRKEGERERAAAVKKLPKPSVAAWAVNQASRCRPKERRALLAASAELRDVQERLLAGDATAADLERATKAQREAIGGLVEAAAGLLTSEGKSLGDATLARVRETFAAVATDPDLADLVEAGTLDRERQATSLGFGFTPAAPPKRSGKAKPPAEAAAAAHAKAGGAKPKPGGAKPKPGGSAKPKPGGSAKGAASAGASEAAAREREERERRAEEARAARQRLKAAKREVRESERRVEAAERAARKAAEEVGKRERQLAEARERADAARQELDAAGAARDEAEAEAERAAAAAAAEEAA